MTILDVDLMLNIDRYRKVNVDASRSEDIFNPIDQDAGANAEFLLRCINKIDDVSFADQDSAQIYARFKQGELIEWDKAYLDHLPEENCLIQVFTRYEIIEKAETAAVVAGQLIEVAEEKHYTLGQWANV
jgi:hypothetical protein